MVALPPERREELLALLADEQRLRTEYPKVSEYLDMAPSLAGTGDPQADAAFDLRFVHHVTGGGAANPYWDIVAPAVAEHGGRRIVPGSARLAYAQMILQSIYAYAIPSPETIAWLAGFCAGRPVVELGAGRGYWAAQLTRAGMSVEAYDVEPPDRAANPSFPRAGRQADVWHPVGDLDEFARSDWSDHVLFLCWPPGWGNTMASAALAAFGGERLVFVGQSRGGMTGDEAFFDALAGWRLATEDARFVSWWNLADVAQGWVRR